MKTIPSKHGLYDFEVKIVLPTGTEEIITIGYSPSETEACARAVSFPSRAGASAVVLRVICEYAPSSTSVGQLSESWEPVPGHPGRRYVLRDPEGREAASEHEGGHLLTAFNFLTSKQPAAAWKTVKLLKALRQAFREDSVNCHDLYLNDLHDAAPSRDRVQGYLSGARARDRAHHGCHTF